MTRFGPRWTGPPGASPSAEGGVSPATSALRGAWAAAAGDTAPAAGAGPAAGGVGAAGAFGAAGAADAPGAAGAVRRTAGFSPSAAPSFLAAAPVPRRRTITLPSAV